MNLDASDGVLLRNVTLIQREHAFERVLHNLLHAHKSCGDGTMTRKGLGSRILHGEAQDRVAVTFDVVRIEEFEIAIDLDQRWISVVSRKLAGDQLLLPLVFHTHGEQDIRGAFKGFYEFDRFNANHCAAANRTHCILTLHLLGIRWLRRT